MTTGQRKQTHFRQVGFLAVCTLATLLLCSGCIIKTAHFYDTDEERILDFGTLFFGTENIDYEMKAAKEGCAINLFYTWTWARRHHAAYSEPPYDKAFEYQALYTSGSAIRTAETP